MRLLALSLILMLTVGCNHMPEPPAIPLGTHTQYEHYVLEPIGDSMWPKLKSGEPIIMIIEDWGDIKIGDVVWVKNGPVHRVYKAQRNGTYLLKGDMNGLTADIRPLTKEAYLGTFAYTVKDYKKWLSNQNGL